MVAVVAALAHVYFVDRYVSTLWKQVLWGLMSAAFVALLVWVRLIKPRSMRDHPWRLDRIHPERGQTTTLALSPGRRRISSRPRPVRVVRVQWWFALLAHPAPLLLLVQRRARRGRDPVKALGDFTSRVHELDPGTTVHVDGPHGVFSIDQDEGPGFGLIPGGVGIAGLPSMLLGWPPADWTGETGYVTAELLARQPPRSYRRFQFLHLRAGAHDGRRRNGAGRAGPAGRARRHRALRHGLNEDYPVRHAQMTRLIWLIAGLVILACLVFTAA
jgi:hypothetical protein